MRKYKMCLGWKYRFKNFITIKRYWSGKIIQFRILCEYGFDIDVREGGFKITDLLTEKEKHNFWMKVNLLRRRN
jgi:hypothetical protein